MDEALLRNPPPQGAFTPYNVTTRGRSARINVTPMSPEQLTILLHKKKLGSGPVKVVNSNYGSICQPGYESHLKVGQRKVKIAAAGHRQRQYEGTGQSFGSSIAPRIFPPKDSDLYRAIMAKNPGKNADRSYPCLVFPTTGSVEVSGAVLDDASDGDRAIDYWVEFLNERKIYEQPVHVIERGNIMTNANFVLNRFCERQVFNYPALKKFLLEESRRHLPPDFFIRESEIQLDSSRADGSFKVRMASAPKRRNTVKMYLKSGKVNFLGFPSPEIVDIVYDFLTDIFTRFWGRLIVMTPHPDNVDPRVLLEESQAHWLAAISDFDRMLYDSSVEQQDEGHRARASEDLDEIFRSMEEDEQDDLATAKILAAIDLEYA